MGMSCCFFMHKQMNIQKDWYTDFSGKYFKTEVRSIANPNIRYAKRVRLTADLALYKDANSVIRELEEQTLIEIYESMMHDGIFEERIDYIIKPY